METLLSAGVHLHVIPKKQFKATRLTVNFTAPQDQVNFAARNLVASLLITSTEKYPSQVALARHLVTLFGAALEADVSRIGRTHSLRIGLTVVNDRIANAPLFNRAVALVDEVLNHPQLAADGFDPATFVRQRTNLASTLQSWADDKRYYALQKLEETYYDPEHGRLMQIPAAGRGSQVRALSNGTVTTAYRQMIENDRVDIVVVGDVDPAAVTAALAALPWTKRRDPVDSSELFYQQGQHPDLWRASEHQPLQQTKFDQAYCLPVEYRAANYPTAMVLNGLFGGSPASLLFTELREGASLAYEASSSFHALTGHLVVETGIQPSNLAQARQLIATQLKRLQTGQFSVTRMKRVQEGLVNQYVAGLDSLGTFGLTTLLGSLTGRPAEGNLGADLRAVTKNDVVVLARQVALQAEFRLEGQTDGAN